LERTVRNLRNTLVHGFSETQLIGGGQSSPDVAGEAMETDSDTESSFPKARSLWRNRGTALVALAALVEQIEAVREDKKREAFEALLFQLRRKTKSQPRYICVFCSSRATASYLQSVLAHRNQNAWLLTGDNTTEEINRTLNGFYSQGGILVSTGAAMKGSDLRYVEVLIHYDPPVSEAEMRVRVTRSPTATNYILVDRSGVRPTEWAAVNV
jgi:hypothetical protein